MRASVLWGLSGATLFAVGALGGLHALGWSSRPLPWTAATGFDRLSSAIQSASLAEGSSLASLHEEAPDLRWLGHAGFLLRWHGQVFLLDPNTSDRCKIARRTLEASQPAAELGAVDAVLLSHAHFDHLDLPTLRGLLDVESVLVPKGSEHYIADALPTGTRVEGLSVGESRRYGEVELIATEAAHNGSRYHPFASRHRAVGWVVRAGGVALFFAGDSGLGSHFQTIGNRYRPQLAILPIGAYAPAWPLRRYHLSPEDAVEAAARLGVELVIPAHFGTFRLALDRPDDALPRFARAAQERGLRWAMPRFYSPLPAGIATMAFDPEPTP